jgi:hypothetical protein
MTPVSYPKRNPPKAATVQINIRTNGLLDFDMVEYVTFWLIMKARLREMFWVTWFQPNFVVLVMVVLPQNI